MKKVVFLFPGQGSQYVGMGREFYEQYEGVRDLFGQASDKLSVDFRKLCFEGPESDLLQTQNVQPAITLINAACLKVLKEAGISPCASAGHSLGEYAALYAAAVMNFTDLMSLVRCRGAFMKESADKNPGGMIAVMGDFELDAITRICKEVGDIGHADIANLNSPKQVIISGEAKALERVLELIKKEVSKLVIPLKVSGPWHSKFMHEAGDKMRNELTKYSFQRPALPVIANVTGDYESEPNRIKTNLISQITQPVRWLQSIERFIKDGYNIFVEVGPNKVLKGLLRDINKEVTVFNVDNVKTFEVFLSSINAV